MSEYETDVEMEIDNLKFNDLKIDNVKVEKVKKVRKPRKISNISRLKSIWNILEKIEYGEDTFENSIVEKMCEKLIDKLNMIKD